MSEVPSFIRTGQNGLAQLASGSFIKLEAGKPISIIPLTGVEPPPGKTPTGNNCVISFMQYAAWMENLPEGQRSPIFPQLGGKDDPGALLGLEPKFRALMLCTVEGEEEEKILPMGAQLFKQLVEIEQALGQSIKGRVLRISRTGSGMQTKYRAVATGAFVEVTGEPELDLTENIGPTSRAEIVEMLTKVGMWPPKGGDPFAEGAPKSKKSGAKKVPFEVKEESADSDDDEEYEGVD